MNLLLAYVEGVQRVAMVMRVHVLVSAADGDHERFERAAAALHAELRELDVENVVRMAREQSTPGSRVWEVAKLGKIVVTGVSAAAQERLIDAWRRAHAVDRAEEHPWLIAAH